MLLMKPSSDFIPVVRYQVLAVATDVKSKEESQNMKQGKRVTVTNSLKWSLILRLLFQGSPLRIHLFEWMWNTLILLFINVWCSTSIIRTGVGKIYLNNSRFCWNYQKTNESYAERKLTFISSNSISQCFFQGFVQLIFYDKTGLYDMLGKHKKEISFPNKAWFMCVIHIWEFSKP